MSDTVDRLNSARHSVPHLPPAPPRVTRRRQYPVGRENRLHVTGDARPLHHRVTQRLQLRDRGGVEPAVLVVDLTWAARVSKPIWVSLNSGHWLVWRRPVELSGRPAQAADRQWMGRYEKTLAKVPDGRSDANIRFADLRVMLEALGFVEERIKGSHHTFTLEGREGSLNLQPDGSKAKAYQVRQIREIIIEQELVSGDEDE